MIGAAFLASAIASCSPIPGAAPVLANPKTEFLFVGELHGTTETPALFADLVCEAAEKRHVLVAIEQRTADQPAIDAYLSSDGGAAAKAEFLRSQIWTNNFKDGRSSRAMFALIERMRLLKQAGRIIDLMAFDPPAEPRPNENGNAARNRAMAESIQAIAARNPDALVMILTGSVHASRAEVKFGTNSILPAAARLPKEKTVSIYADGNTGMAWNCTDDCAPHPWISHASGPRRLTIGSRPLRSGVTSANAFDASLYAGIAFTASEPMIAAKPQP